MDGLPPPTMIPGSSQIPYNIQQAISSLSSTANNLASSSVPRANGHHNPHTFHVPAHKHAHHLHSIPPREKSTRTLIIDHMLWVHARTRFAQARAELGMTDRTGGPSSQNYAHRTRPENYEEEDGVRSDGEDAVTLKARTGDPSRPHNDDEEERLQRQDLYLARSLCLRAEGLERVVTSMLDQPPPIHHHPMEEEEVTSPQSSPKLRPSLQRDHPHYLPNGVRLRLGLGTLINDLFARQAPLPPSQSTQQSNPTEPSVVPPLPPALDNIAAVSPYSPTQFSSFDRYPSGNGRMKSLNKPSPRVRSLYDAGADPDPATIAPPYRCPRHLHTGCEICVEARNPTRPALVGRSNSIDRPSQALGGGGLSGWQEGGGIGAGLARPGPTGTILRRKNTFDAPGAKASHTKLSELIPRFLRLSALVASELGREMWDEAESATSSYSSQRSSPSPSEPTTTTTTTNMALDELPPLPEPASLQTIQAVNAAEQRKFRYSVPPSRAWYMLLAGLLTRAALEGYMTAGWRGPGAVECLLTCGLGARPRDDSAVELKPEDAPVDETKEDSEDHYEEFDPYDLPNLMDAVKMLFPSLRGGAPIQKGHPEEEYELEMEERLRRFFDIPATTPDLATHMEDLAWQYPAEPVERAAVRYCEAIAKWRGKPELETYKKRNPVTPNLGPPTTEAEAGGVPRNSIEFYFTPPVTDSPWSWPGPKRMRSEDDDGDGERSKRQHGD